VPCDELVSMKVLDAAPLFLLPENITLTTITEDNNGRLVFRGHLLGRFDYFRRAAQICSAARVRRDGSNLERRMSSRL
jgi:hypothetical protein